MIVSGFDLGFVYDVIYFVFDVLNLVLRFIGCERELFYNDVGVLVWL